MATIIISTNASLDGVVQDPDGGEGFERGGWFSPVGSPERAEWAEIEAAEAERADALLVGRRSYEWFAARWATRDGDWADRLRALPKFVVSSNPSGVDATWGPTTILSGEVRESVTRLKAERDGEILVYASYELGQTLLDHDLVDELRVFVYPAVLGAGRRLFGETVETKALRLRDARTVGGQLVFVTYEAGGATVRHGIEARGDRRDRQRTQSARGHAVHR